jgi:hypothetical protein
VKLNEISGQIAFGITRVIPNVFDHFLDFRLFFQVAFTNKGSQCPATDLSGEVFNEVELLARRGARDSSTLPC